MKRRSVVSLANEHVSILLVCELIGMSVPSEVVGNSYKVYCPFGTWYHSDQGASKSFRIYPDSNTANCFAACGYFTPVWLAASARGHRPVETAVWLLDQIGYKPASQAQLWADVQHVEPEPSISALSVALRTYCERIDPGWGFHQYEPPTSHTFDRCLRLLDFVKSEDDAEEWLAAGKDVMRRILRGDIHSGKN